MNKRGSVSNLLNVYSQARSWEREEGRLYYGRQKKRLSKRAKREGLSLESVVAAFCALSPNNAESTNYRALDTCLAIRAGRLPPTAKVIAYPENTKKALLILSGSSIEENLRGRKVYSFYRNTLDEEDREFVTVDGHMLGAWAGRRFVLRREAEIKSKEYEEIKKDFLEASLCVDELPTHFQATVWLTWKRIHRILYRPPQLQFEFQPDPFAFHPGCLLEVGVFTPRATSSTPAALPAKG